MVAQGRERERERERAREREGERGRERDLMAIRRFFMASARALE